jgi:hypothetical protein
MRSTVQQPCLAAVRKFLDNPVNLLAKLEKVLARSWTFINKEIYHNVPFTAQVQTRKEKINRREGVTKYRHSYYLVSNRTAIQEDCTCVKSFFNMLLVAPEPLVRRP